ncbi:FmdB family zinc ribbon protein [Klugiella xanthotipulae]|uniref:Putative FmdB family regulatory protein n=1 Tax=Klugiella xanthotipulae TaxID=244735 RepID=A0A543HYM6_9MICO|nr:FmdB family zinc ribbon protein [Klugiella xanthotipulae]TQM63345.1 putative FmdB family regulatory protein [Klugiella xanthotipulae]
MPTYSYRCTQCHNAFDIRQEFSDASLTDCPECGGRLRKVFNSIGVTFNGSGFYRTDSRAGGSPAGVGASASSSSEGTGSSSSSGSSASVASSGSTTSGSSSSAASSAGSSSGSASGS